MSSVNEFLDLFSEVWVKGIFGVNVSKCEFNKLQCRVKKQLHGMNFEHMSETEDTNTVNKYKYMSLQRKYNLLEKQIVNV